MSPSWRSTLRLHRNSFVTSSTATLPWEISLWPRHCCPVLTFYVFPITETTGRRLGWPWPSFQLHEQIDEMQVKELTKTLGFPSQFTNLDTSPVWVACRIFLSDHLITTDMCFWDRTHLYYMRYAVLKCCSLKRIIYVHTSFIHSLMFYNATRASNLNIWQILELTTSKQHISNNIYP